VADNPKFNVLNNMHTTVLLTYVPKWPLLVHLFSACFCLGASAMFHLFQIHSGWVDSIMSRLDYGGISILIMGSSYPPIYYVFTCEPVYWHQTFFLILITATSTSCFVVTMLPSMNTPKWRPFRGIMFIVLGLSAGIPFVYT
jgi:adiponectin receptor